MNRTSDIERRLHAAYAAKASTVTEATLRPEPPAPAPIIAPKRHSRGPFLAAAAVVALGAGIVSAVLLAGGTPPPPAQPRPSVTGQHTTVATGAPTALPTAAPTSSTPTAQQDVLPRSAVPWAQVGSGWLVVSRTRAENGPVTVELVAPDGTAYRIVTLPGQLQPALWSPDHQRLLVTASDRVEEVTLRTGSLRVVPLPAGVEPVSYTRPTGTALLAVGGDGVLRRYDLATGAVQQAYASAEPGIGPLNLRYVRYDADGGMLAVMAQSGLAVLANDGHLLHAYPAPAGTADCTPTRWNGTSSVEAACTGSSGGGATNVWRFPLEGVAAVQLTHGPHGNNIFGYSDIWSAAGGRLGLAPNGCGPATLVRFDAEGVGTEVDVPVPPGVAGPYEYVGHSGDTVLLMGHATGQCQPSGFTLLAYDAATNGTAAIAGPVNSDGRLLPDPLVLPEDH